MDKTFKHTIRLVMFDQYGTVVDMQGGLVQAIEPFLKEKGYKGSANSLVTWWRRTHFENSMIDALLGHTHTSYREIGQRALAYTLERAQIEHRLEDLQRLVSCIEALKCFPEVPQALNRIKAKYPIVVFSNGDPDMLEAAKVHHGIEFDRVLSVSAAGAFKPHAATYHYAASEMGVKPSEILFVANHAFDCIGAKAAGMKSAFINRRSRPFGQTPYQPDVIFKDMGELADMLCSH
jgi:2-haloacid dehalogenase